MRETGCGKRRNSTRFAQHRQRNRSPGITPVGQLPCSAAMGGRPALQAASLVIAATFQYVSVRRFSVDQEERFAPQRRLSDFDMAITLSPSTRVNAVIGTGHFLSHYYQLCLPPMFLAWQS